MSRLRRKDNKEPRTEIVVALIGAAAVVLAALITLLPPLLSRQAIVTPRTTLAAETVGVTDLPAAAPLSTEESPASEGSSAATAGNCLVDYVADIPSERQITLEADAGGRNLLTPADWLAQEEPVGPLAIHLAHGGRAVGVVRFLLLHDGTDFIGFSVLSAMTDTCQEVSGLENVIRTSSGPPVALQNWDTLRVPLVTGDYALRFGWQGDRIRLSLRALS